MTTATDNLYHALFTTAIEGGINYWADVHSYHWSVNGDAKTDDLKGFKATVKDIEDDSKGLMAIDRSVIARGYRLATSTEWHSRISWSCERPPVVVTDDSDWDFDAMDADVIVQLGLWGDVVYG